MITAYSTSGYEISCERREEYDQIPSSEKWRAHRTLPAAEFLNLWTAQYSRLVNMLVLNIIGGPTTGSFLTRARNPLSAERLAQETGPLEEWHPEMQELVQGIEDDQVRQREIARWQHVAVSQTYIEQTIVPRSLFVTLQNVYSCFLRHGWPDSFDKSTCRVEVIELQEQAWAAEKAFMDAINPDAGLFDD